MSDDKITQLLSDLALTNPGGHELALAARQTIRAVAPAATERVMYGGFMFADTAQFCGVFAYKDHVSVEFGRGCDLADTHGVLEGNGKLRRHIKLHSLADVAAKHLRGYVAQAHAITCR
ncbi:MAG: DUF1801 domain-containing protein [Rhodocyclales bacterium]|nr:DUF1801 domain-containing protein [Rhodocyclales bacterium]